MCAAEAAASEASGLRVSGCIRAPRYFHPYSDARISCWLVPPDARWDTPRSEITHEAPSLMLGPCGAVGVYVLDSTFSEICWGIFPRPLDTRLDPPGLSVYLR